jgi:hypothetical protein
VGSMSESPLTGENFSRGRAMPESPSKVKAPFRLTTMNDSGQSPWLWLWSLRGKRWVVNQVLPLDAPRNCSPRDSKGGTNGHIDRKSV